MTDDLKRHHGACQCGSVSYAVETPKLVAYACHCGDCQKQSTSAFALSVPVARVALTVMGTTNVYSRPAVSGATTACHFCPSCGSRLYHQSSGSPEFVTLKGGTLVDAGVLNPIAHLWISRKHGWLQLPGDVPTFATQPDDLKAWRTALLADNAA